MTLIIRQERDGDAASIHDVTVAAFRNAPHTDHTEQYVVRALRDAGALSISLVAEISGVIIGHVAVSPVTLSSGAKHWYGLGPISVVPEEQSKGIGAQLMEAALMELKSLGANGCVLLGDPAYYHRFGFKPVVGLVLPGVPAEYFQAILFKGGFPQGDVTYHAAFSVKV